MLTHATLLTGTGRAGVLSLLLVLSLLASSPCLATSDALGDVVSALTGAPYTPLLQFPICINVACSAGLLLCRVTVISSQLFTQHLQPGCTCPCAVTTSACLLGKHFAWQAARHSQALTAHLSAAGCKDKNAIYFVSDYNENQVRAFHGTSGAQGMRFFVGVAYRTKCRQLSTWVRRQVHWCRAAAK